MVGLARSSFAFESWFFGWRIVYFLCYELAMRLLTLMLEKLLHWFDFRGYQRGDFARRSWDHILPAELRRS